MEDKNTQHQTPPRQQEWVEVHRIKNEKNQAVSIQRLELQNGRKKYSLRLGFERPDGQMSSFVEFRTRAGDVSTSDDTTGALISLLNSAGDWLMEQTQKDRAEWEESRPSRGDRNNRGSHPSTKREGKTARDKAKKGKKGPLPKTSGEA